MVDYISLASLVYRPGGIVRKGVDLEWQPLGGRLHLSHHQGHPLVNTRVLSQIVDDISPEGPNIGQLPLIGDQIGVVRTAPVVLLEGGPLLRDIVTKELIPSEVLDLFRGEEADGPHIDID